MKLLIVVDKLLTGFDAPSATYLYIDKHMQDHGLFQAICRINRLDSEDKEYGYVIDYKDLFRSLEKSITDYTGEAFADYDKEDMKTIWGSCNVEAKRIWLNLELAKKSESCLVYILVHEMVHLLERDHNDRFRELMDKFLPQWRTYRDTLNRAPLAHEDWRY